MNLTSITIKHGHEEYIAMILDGLNATFVTLLEANVEDPGFEVREDEENFVITTSSSNTHELSEKLENIFKSHWNTARHIPFKLNPSNNQNNINQNTTPFPQVKHPLLSISDIQQAIAQHGTKQIIKKLFGKEILDSTGIPPAWQETQSQNNHQAVYYYICKNELDIRLRNSQIDAYKHILSHATWEELYLTLATNNSQPLTNKNMDSNEVGTGPLSFHLEKLFFIREESGKSVVYFDCIGLIKCIIAPKFTQTDQQLTSPTKSEILVNKLHFMTYMATLLHPSQGILLHERTKQQLLPIAVQCHHAIQSSTLIDFGIDCSGSMNDVFPRVKTLLKDLITALHDHPSLDNHATWIRLSRFGSKKTEFQPIEYNLTEFSTLIKAVDGFSRPDQETAMYQFIQKQFASFKCSDKHNIVSILLSDGKDNDSELKYKPNLEKNDELSKTLSSLENDTSPPKFFSIEIGNLVDEIVLEAIKNATHGERIKAENGLENFHVFFNHLGKLAMYRSFIHFAQQARQFKLPSIEGKFTIVDDPNNYLTPDLQFKMNSQDYVATSTQQPCVNSVATQIDEPLETTPAVIESQSNQQFPHPSVLMVSTNTHSYCGFKSGFLLPKKDKQPPVKNNKQSAGPKPF